MNDASCPPVARRQHCKVLKDSLQSFEGDTAIYITTSFLCLLHVHAKQIFDTECQQVKLLEVIGHGTYGQVHKAVWRDKIVAAKVIPAPSINQKIIDNELSVLRLAQQPYRVYAVLLTC